MKLYSLVPNIYIYVSVNYLYIPMIDQPILMQQYMCGSIVGIYKSIKDTGMWLLGTRPRSFISGST